MPSNIILKKSSVVAKVPVAGDLQFGELALNYADGKLYYKKSDGTTIDAFQAGSGSAASGKITATTSGIVTAGTPVIVNPNGTVSSVAISQDSLGTTSYISDFSKGNRSTSVYIDHASATAHVFRRNSDGNVVCIISTISGSTVTMGTPVVVASVNASFITATYDPVNQKLIVTYYTGGSNAWAVVGTVSGTTVSFGALNALPTATMGTGTREAVSSYFDIASGKVVIAGTFNAVAQAVVGTVSGTTISFGALTQFSTVTTPFISCTYNSVTNSALFVYSGSAASGRAIVATVSGNTISFGTELTFNASAIMKVSSTFDASAGKILVSFIDVGNSSFGTLTAATISGTSVSFSPFYVFLASTLTVDSPTSISYNSADNKSLVLYGVGQLVYSKTIKFTGTTFELGSELTVGPGGTTLLDADAAYDVSANKWLLTYSDYYITQVAETAGGTNLTATNYIGFPAATYASGVSSATILTVGSVTPTTNLSGLTIGALYYVQNDGTLSTVPTALSVVAGTAVTTDSILIADKSLSNIAVADDTTASATYYPVFATASSGSLSSLKVSSTRFTFNPSNGYFRAGNIGINIAPGSTPLDINHEGALTFGLRVGDNATVTNSTGIYLRTTSTGTIAWGAGGKLVFATSGGSVTRFTIGSNGQFGVGAAEDYGLNGEVLMSTGPTTAPTWSYPGTRTATIATGTSITMNSDTTDIAIQVNTQVAGTLTINAPTGTPVDGQKLMLRLQATNAQTFSFNAIFAGSTDLPLPITSSSGSKYDYLGFMYNSAATKWQLIAKNFGF